MSPSFSGLNLVLLGPPGSGKGTQACGLAESYCIPHISTGDLLRAEIERGSFVGEAAREAVEKGTLVPDKLMAGLILERIDRDDCARGFILDGYPRNVEQAGLLDGILGELGRVIERVILLLVPDGSLLARPSDDPPEVLRERLRVYRASTAPVVELYRARGQLIEVDGDRPPEKVAQALRQAIGAPVDP